MSRSTEEQGTGELLVSEDGPVLNVVFNRPEQHNAMTWGMYDGLYQACERADTDPQIKLMVLRGAGERAFVAGTDIEQFAEFTDGEDGVAYEERITRVLDRLAEVSVPTLAGVRGHCVGGGLAIAAVCDLRVATRTARFGIPIARTLGNCLSMDTCNLLVHHLGPARTLDLIMNARVYSGEEAHQVGFVCDAVDDGEFTDTVEATVQRLLSHAPLTMWAVKQSVRRLIRGPVPEGDDIVATVYASSDFRSAVQAFQTKTKPRWQGC